MHDYNDSSHQENSFTQGIAFVRSPIIQRRKAVNKPIWKLMEQTENRQLVEARI